jgi:ribonuclease III
MENTTEWINYRDEICYPVEKYLLGYSVQNKERLVSAIISNAFINEKPEFKQLTKIPADKSLETIGDFVLDFAILEHFPKKESTTPQEVDDNRAFYGKNGTLTWFSKNRLHLQNFILWGPDERVREVWNSPEVLADRFEMLIGVIYLERGIEAVKEFLIKQKFFEEIDKNKENLQ